MGFSPKQANSQRRDDVGTYARRQPGETGTLESSDTSGEAIGTNKIYKASIHWTFVPQGSTPWLSTMMTLDTKIADLTVGEFQELLRTALCPEAAGSEYATGIAGLAKALGVSYSTAKRLKASGVLDKAITQTGKVIITDVALARQLLTRATHGRHINK